MTHLMKYCLMEEIVDHTDYGITIKEAAKEIKTKKGNIIKVWRDFVQFVVERAMKMMMKKGWKTKSEQILERIKDINEFMKARIIPMANKRETKAMEAWRAIQVAAKINDTKKKKDEKIRKWTSLDFRMTFDENMKRSHRMEEMDNVSNKKLMKQRSLGDYDLETTVERNACHYCGRTGHYKWQCRVKENERAKGWVRSNMGSSWVKGLEPPNRRQPRRPQFRGYRSYRSAAVKGYNNRAPMKRMSWNYNDTHEDEAMETPMKKRKIEKDISEKMEVDEDGQTNEKGGFNKIKKYRYNKKDKKYFGNEAMKICEFWEAGKCRFHWIECHNHHMCKKCGLVDDHTTAECE